MKKLHIGLGVLLACYATNANAALPTGTANCQIAAPDYCCGFNFGLTTLYWRPVITKTDYALTYPLFEDEELSFKNGSYHNVNSSYSWGYIAYLGYRIPCSPNDLNLSLTQWNSGDGDRIEHFGFGFPSIGDDSLPSDASELSFSFPQGLPLTGGTISIPLLAITAPVIVGNFAPGSFDIIFTPQDLISVQSRSSVRNETWDLNVGQRINIGSRLVIHGFGGLRYSHLQHDFRVIADYDASGLLVLPTVVTPVIIDLSDPFIPVIATGELLPIFDVTALLHDVTNQQSNFRGIGPRFGFDASYHLGRGFGMVGSLSFALLIGEDDASLSERLESLGSAIFNPDLFVTSAILDLDAESVAIDPVAITAINSGTEVISYHHPDSIRVVPNIDAKLGLDWSYVECCCGRYKVTVEAGYKISHYLNPIDRLSTVGANTPEIRSRQTIDLSFRGPYLGVQVNI